MLEVLRVIPIPAELAAAVALVLLFLYFGSKDKAELNATMTRISDNMIAHNAKIADKFDANLRDINREVRENQRNYQLQLQELTDSHIKVSHEFIRMLAEIKSGFGEIESAFHAQTVDLKAHAALLDRVERDIEELRQKQLGQLEKPAAGGPLPPPPFERG